MLCNYQIKIKYEVNTIVIFSPTDLSSQLRRFNKSHTLGLCSKLDEFLIRNGPQTFVS